MKALGKVELLMGLEKIRTRLHSEGSRTVIRQAEDALRRYMPPEPTRNTIVQEIDARLTAIANCKKQGNVEWERQHGEILDRIEKLLPAGIGMGTRILRDDSVSGRVVLMCEFHHMNGAGHYSGWTQHRIIVTPNFRGLHISVGGANRNGIKDYLHDVYDSALQELLPEKFYEETRYD